MIPEGKKKEERSHYQLKYTLTRRSERKKRGEAGNLLSEKMVIGRRKRKKNYFEGLRDAQRKKTRKDGRLRLRQHGKEKRAFPLIIVEEKKEGSQRPRNETRGGGERRGKEGR